MDQVFVSDYPPKPMTYVNRFCRYVIAMDGVYADNAGAVIGPCIRETTRYIRCSYIMTCCCWLRRESYSAQYCLSARSNSKFSRLMSNGTVTHWSCGLGLQFTALMLLCGYKCGPLTALFRTLLLTNLSAVNLSILTPMVDSVSGIILAVITQE